MAAGCAGYIVSFLGRVLYFGRTAETHTELFSAATLIASPSTVAGSSREAPTRRATRRSGD